MELLVALAILGVTLGIAAPSLGTFLSDSGRTALAGRILSSLLTARSESIKANAPVTLCPSTDGASCAETPWSGGWIVFIDRERIGVVDSDDETVRVAGATPRRVSIVADGLAERVTFAPDGTVDAAGAFAICDARPASAPRWVCVARVGRAWISETPCTARRTACAT